MPKAKITENHKENNKVAPGKTNFLNFPMCLRQESDLYCLVRSEKFYPLNYEGLQRNHIKILAYFQSKISMLQ